MKKIPLLTLFAITFTTCYLQSCSQPSADTTQSTAPSQGKLTLSGANTIATIVSEIANSYRVQHPSVQIDVQATVSWRGIADVRQGTADIGMVTRSLKSDEQDLLAFTIAKDGLTVILHQKNPVKSLTDQQIADIYTDKINNWKQVGGIDAPIIVASRVENGAALELFTEHFKLEPSSLRVDVVVSNTKESIEAVVENANTISYSSIGYAEAATASGMAIKLLPIDGVTASGVNVSNGTFPITRPLNLITKNPPSPLAKEFIDLALSKEGQNIIKEKKFVPVSP